MPELERPGDFSPQEVALWDAVVEKLVERADFDVLWAASIERYVRATELGRAAWRKVPKRMTARGSMGQPTAHPMIAVAQKADAEAAKYGAMLGIEPVEAKRGVGRPRGSVSAPDRSAPKPPAKITKLKLAQ